MQKRDNGNNKGGLNPLHISQSKPLEVFQGENDISESSDIVSDLYCNAVANILF